MENFLSQAPKRGEDKLLEEPPKTLTIRGVILEKLRSPLPIIYPATGG